MPGSLRRFYLVTAVIGTFKVVYVGAGILILHAARTLDRRRL